MEKILKFVELATLVKAELGKQLVPSHVLLDKFRVIDEASRSVPAYSDPNYIPFYYHLGKFIQPRSLLEIGTNLGFFSGCFLKSCSSVERLLLFQQQTDEHFSKRFAIRNIKQSYKKSMDFHVGEFKDLQFDKQTWDLVFFNEELAYDACRIRFDLLWNSIAENGFMICDRIGTNKAIEKAFRDFCKVQNRDSAFVQTRYGTGIVQR